jgi:TetR/AcrR family transcriptional repressor of nem operon
MRYRADHKQETRERVLKEAVNAIRADGVDKLGVASIMAKAGLTHGGFYAHFANREALVAAAIEEMIRQGGARFERSMLGRAPAEGLADYLDFYLSAAHRDTRTAGCPLPFLSADAPRLADPMRQQFASGVHAMTDHLGRVLATLGFDGVEDLAGSMLSEMVGAVALARAEPDPARSDAILARTRASLKGRLGLEALQ